MEVIFFSVADATYVARLTSLAEVLMPATLRPMPAGPRFVRGLMNLRGHIMPVIDLRERLHLPPRSGFLRRNRILRVPTLSGELGVVVDAVQRIAVLDESQRRDDATGTDAGADSRSGQGFAGPFWQVDGELLQELRLERLLNGEETLALGWEPERGQIDFNRLLEPNVGESEQP